MPALARPIHEERSDAGQRFDPPKPDLSQWVTHKPDGSSHMDLLVPGIHCAGCISRIEKKLHAHPGMITARVNLSTKRLSLDWQDGLAEPQDLIGDVESLGFDARPFTPEAATESTSTGRELLMATAVAGFAAGNVMLLSVSVWSGAEAATRDLFHWISALIALPAIAFASRPFVRSAFKALRAGQLNMDVPISLAVILAAAISLYETMTGGPNAYFDAAVMLLFFLLIGRTLDHMMRARAQSAVTQLLSLNARGATVISGDGSRCFADIASIRSGMTVAVAAGERVPVDGEVIRGASDLDRSIVTGEATPEAVAKGSLVEAGTMNLTGPLEIRVTATGEDTFLAEVVRLMEAAEQGKARFVALADKAAGIYAPLVHILAALTFAGWLIAGAGWHAAALTAIAVLIITCPCALGLAVPVVQVVASSVLMRAGVMVKDGMALERLAAIDTVIFDKTGTLTKGNLTLDTLPPISTQALSIAAGLTFHSNHPLSRAMAQVLSEKGIVPAKLTAIREVPGFGLSAHHAGKDVRIGSREWVGLEAPGDHAQAELCLGIEGTTPKVFTFHDELRGDAAGTVAKLKSLGLRTVILSGDREAAVRQTAEAIGLDMFHAGWKPQDKEAYVTSLENAGEHVLMVGDGINDAPALAAAHASMAPSAASDIGRTAAGLIFLGDRLSCVVTAYRTARFANRLVKQNFAIAALYNLIAVPIAIAGLASPLVAAIAMSSSSLIVTGNALRLRLFSRKAA